MTVLNVTLDFSSDNGDAENFDTPVAYLGSCTGTSNQGYDGSIGNPAGSAHFRITGSSGTHVCQYHWAQSFEAWGIPAGATINSISAFAVDGKAVVTGTVTSGNLVCVLRINGTAKQTVSHSTGASSWDWGALSSTLDDSSGYPFASTDTLSVALGCYGSASGSNAIDYYYDNIYFEIDYTATADVDLEGTFNVPAFDFAGAAAFTDVDVRLFADLSVPAFGFSGGLSIDDELLAVGAFAVPGVRFNGIVFIPLSDTADNLPDAGLRYTLTVDGTEYPLISAVVERHSRYERASATIPTALVQGIIDSSPVTLEITVTRVLADGSGTTDTTLFTGTVDLTATTSGDQTGTFYADGSASYPARVNRQLQGAPSYVRDSADSAAVRGQIDPDLVPGDVLRFSGVREIPVTKAVFNLTTDFQFMEAISGY